MKRAITGNGSAGKAQMQRGVQTVLGLDELPRPSHVADALGLAVTGMARVTGRIPAGRARAVSHDRIASRAASRQARGPRDPRGGGRRLRGVPAPGHPARARAASAGNGDGGDEVALAVHYHATQNQPRPVLIGFTSELDKEFFEKLITVKDVGPLVAARALAAPVGEIAAAIARQDEPYLRRLPGIGPQKAKNIVAQLQNKVAKFALPREPPRRPSGARPRRRAPVDDEGLRGMVFEVLVKQLGHRPSEAAELIDAALRRRAGIVTPEELFDEIYRGRTGA